MSAFCDVGTVGNNWRASASIACRCGPDAIALLKDHRDRATSKSADDLVFPNKSGEPLRESKLLERVLQPTAGRVGRVTWHQQAHKQRARGRKRAPEGSRESAMR